VSTEIGGDPHPELHRDAGHEAALVADLVGGSESSAAFRRGAPMPQHWKFWFYEPNSQLLQFLFNMSAAGA